jgi:hypothetical protein
MRAIIMKNIIAHFYYFSQVFAKGLLYFLLFATGFLLISLISSRQSKFWASILSKGR